MTDDRQPPAELPDAAPFRDDPEAEFAPTIAMPAVPGPASPPHALTELHAPPDPAPRGQAAPLSPTRAAPLRRETPASSGHQRPGFSSLLSCLGGLGIALSFFLPMLSGSYVTDAMMREVRFMPAELLFEDLGAADPDDLPDALRARAEAGRDALRSIGFDVFFDAYHAAESESAQQQLIRDYGISPFQTMRFFQVLDFDAASLEVDRDTRAGSRGLWVVLLWLAVSGVVAVLLAALRGFRPLNGFQIGWNGLFGLLWLLSAAAMLLVDESKAVGGVDLRPFQGVGLQVLLGSAALLWVSAFAGLSARNWWTAPLFGLLLVVVLAATCVGPVLALTL